MRLFPQSVLSLAAASVCALALVGCGDDKKPAPDAAPATPAAAPAAAAPAAQPEADNKQAQIKARNAYTKAYNYMIDDNRSVAALYRSYKGLRINDKKHNELSFYGGPDDIERMIKPMKEARVAGSGDAQLDSAADAVIASGDKLIAVWSGMQTYFRSKGFLEDNWVKAKENDPAMSAGFEGMIASIDKLGTELDRVQDASRLERMAKLKAEGNMLDYSVQNSMAIAKRLVNGVERTNGLKNAEAIAKVDEEAKALGAAVEELNQAMAAEKQKTGKDLNYEYRRVSESLTSLIGDWRSLKKNRSEGFYKNLVRSYNSAVSSASSGFGK